MLKFASGIESTLIHGTGEDNLGLTDFINRYEEDLSLARNNLGLTTLRIPLPWNRIEQTEGKFDFTWTDAMMACVRDLGINPIVDPVHHFGPNWLEDGFAHPGFGHYHLRFVQQAVARYPWVTHWTTFNEPLATTQHCGELGVWYPYLTSPHCWVPMVRTVARSICNVNKYLRENVPGAVLVHVDTFEEAQADPRASADHGCHWFADFRNQRRFLYDDLIRGEAHPDNPRFQLMELLTKHGFTGHDIEWFRKHAQPYDIRGGDYYAHSEAEYNDKPQGEDVVIPSNQPSGLTKVMEAYHQRYPTVPIWITETNVRGFISDRVTWLRHTLEQCAQFEQKYPDVLQLFTWWSLTDSYDWKSFCTVYEGVLDPVGLYWLSPDGTRNGSEVTEHYGALARGTMTWQDLPAYRFQSPLNKQLAGFLPFMEDFPWIDPPQ